MSVASDWKCARCAAENPESEISCKACGNMRVEVVSTTPEVYAPPAPPPATSDAMPAPEIGRVDAPGTGQTAWSPGTEGMAPPPARGARRNLIKPIFGAVIAVIVVVYGISTFVGRSTTGEINKAGEMKPSDLRVGDCFDVSVADASAEVEKIAAKPCSEAHQYEAVYAGTMPEGDYPTDAAFEAFVAGNCGPAFGTYVGMGYESSKLELFYFYPSTDSWSHSDRGMSCAVFDPKDTKLTVSLKGAAR